MYGINKIREAIDYAVIMHSGQKRKGSGLDYVTHPIKVGFILQSLNMPYAVVIAGILHDTIEDTNATYDDIKEKFGKEVSNLVLELTTDKKKCKMMGKNEYLKRKMSFDLSKNALCAKLGDRLDNISDNPHDKYLMDTQDMINFIRENREEISIESMELIEKIQFVLNKKRKECK